MPDDARRNVVPRWREFTAAVGAGELDSVVAPPPGAAPAGAPILRGGGGRRAAVRGSGRRAGPITATHTASGTEADRLSFAVEREFAQRVEEWEATRSVGTAADVVATAVVFGITAPIARDAAQFLIDRRAAAGEVAAAAAQRYLAARFPDEHVLKDAPPLRSVVDVLGAERLVAGPGLHHVSTAALFHGMQVRRLRRLLAEDPRNALAWLDLARVYTSNGQRPAATRAIRAALATGGDQRFVLRSVARYYLHIDDPERAHTLLRRAPDLARDPWLMAAEIALAEPAHAAPRSVRLGRQLLAAGDTAPFHLNELASAVATLEARDGKRRIARKLFEQALQAPSDNTVAQAEWAARRHHVLELPDGLLNVPAFFEARARAACAAGRWSDALSACVEWFEDEPFSTRAIAVATTLASSGQGDYVEAAMLAGRGLVANPENPVLRNNLVFALAQAGRVMQARHEYERWSRRAHGLGDSDRIAWEATGGLLAFREGRPDDGRPAYERAIELATASGNRTMQRLVVAYWAAEEALLGAADEEFDTITAQLVRTGEVASVEEVLAVVHLQRARECGAEARARGAAAAHLTGVTATSGRVAGPNAVHALGAWRR